MSTSAIYIDELLDSNPFGGLVARLPYATCVKTPCDR